MTREQACATAFYQTFRPAREEALGSTLLTSVILAGGLLANSEQAVESLVRLRERADGAGAGSPR